MTTVLHFILKFIYQYICNNFGVTITTHSNFYSYFLFSNREQLCKNKSLLEAHGSQTLCFLITINTLLLDLNRGCIFIVVFL